MSQGIHPDGAGSSVLDTSSGPHDTIPPELGVFLDHTRRMHPDVCHFISEAFYENRLTRSPSALTTESTHPAS